MRVDVHVHILPPEVINNIEYYKSKDSYFELLHRNPKSRFATAEDIIKEMDRSGVDVSVVFGFAFKDMGICRMLNDYISDVAKRYSGKLIGFGVLNPLSGEAVMEVKRCKEIGLAGIGELFPDGQGFEVGNSAELGRIGAACRELDMILNIHTNEPVGHYYDGKDSTFPEKAYRFAVANPGLKLIFAHWGGGLFFYELMPEVRETLKTVYYDTAATPFLYSERIFEVAEAAGVIDKILMGSDFPLLGQSRYINQILSTSLTDLDKEKVLGANASRLFNI